MIWHDEIILALRNTHADVQMSVLIHSFLRILFKRLKTIGLPEHCLSYVCYSEQFFIHIDIPKKTTMAATVSIDFITNYTEGLRIIARHSSGGNLHTFWYTMDTKNPEANHFITKVILPARKELNRIKRKEQLDCIA